jgi:hypothetical protein
VSGVLAHERFLGAVPVGVCSPAMRSLFAGLVLLGWLAVGCNRDKPPPPATDSTAQASGKRAGATPAPTPPPATPEPVDEGPAAPTAQLPAPRWKKLPGWLGFTALEPGAKPENDWTPAHPKARVVLFSQAWNDVPAGARVKLVGASGTTQEGTYLGTSTERYGCEQNTATLAAFSAPHPFPEGPVWVLPPDTEGVQAVPVRDVPLARLTAPMLKLAGVSKPQEKEVRAYETGGLTFVLAKKGPRKGLMAVFDGRPVGTVEFDKEEREGADASPMDLSNPHEVGVPRPLAAFRFGAKGPQAVVIGTSSGKDHTFWLLPSRDPELRGIIIDRDYISFCVP